MNFHICYTNIRHKTFHTDVLLTLTLICKPSYIQSLKEMNSIWLLCSDSDPFLHLFFHFAFFSNLCLCMEIEGCTSKRSNRPRPNTLNRSKEWTLQLHHVCLLTPALQHSYIPDRQILPLGLVWSPNDEPREDLGTQRGGNGEAGC